MKLLENTFRHVNIALVNELAMFARELGVDIWSAIDAASTKPFGYMRFTPGPRRRRALPADRPVATCRGGSSGASARRFRFVELANDVNEHMPDYVGDARHGAAEPRRPGGATARGSCCSGSPTRRARPTGASRRRSSSPTGSPRSGADLGACDPHLAEVNLEPTCTGSSSCRSRLRQLAAADLVLVLVDHPEFDPDVIAEHASLVFDTKAVLRGRTFRGELL